MTPPAITPSDSSTVDASGTGEANLWNLYGSANDFSKLMGGAGTVPCYGVAGGTFAKAGCTSVAAVGLLPASCIAAANAAPNGPGGSTATAQLAAVGCYAAGPGNESAIIAPAQGTFGDIQNGTFRLDASGGYKNWDLAVHKDWQFKERFTTQFRVEIYNVTNRTDYYTPSVALGSPTLFGLSPSTPDTGKGDPIIGSGGPRAIQLGLKFIF